MDVQKRTGMRGQNRKTRKEKRKKKRKKTKREGGNWMRTGREKLRRDDGCEEHGLFGITPCDHRTMKQEKECEGRTNRGWKRRRTAWESGKMRHKGFW
jgi:hypothetical protein